MLYCIGVRETDKGMMTTGLYEIKDERLLNKYEPIARGQKKYILVAFKTDGYPEYQMISADYDYIRGIEAGLRFAVSMCMYPEDLWNATLDGAIDSGLKYKDLSDFGEDGEEYG